MDSSLSQTLSEWAVEFPSARLPADVVQATKYRILDVIGLALAGTKSPFGVSVRKGAQILANDGPCHIWGTGEKTDLTSAALANGALSQALEFDDTHNESIVHMSSPSVAAALALAETNNVSGADLLAAVAISNEVACRVGSVTPAQFHKRGFHPSGIFAVFGTTLGAARILKLTPAQAACATGIAGSFSSGLIQCWVDGTHSKFVHPGWAAQSGIVCAAYALSGVTGPAGIFEGRFGVFASHLQSDEIARNWGRIKDGLGTHWESRNASLKPFPAAHVIHPYIDAVLILKKKHAINPADVAKIDCPVAEFIIPIVLEPQAEKLHPNTDSHGRVSFQYTLAEALYRGELNVNAYKKEYLTNPDILALAAKVNYHVDPAYPGPEQFKGEVTITMRDGTKYSHTEEFNRGSLQNPMTREEIHQKFFDNAEGVLSKDQGLRLIEAIDGLDKAASSREIVLRTIGS